MGQKSVCVCVRERERERQLPRFALTGSSHVPFPNQALDV
jgi:hypothetical protein